MSLKIEEPKSGLNNIVMLEKINLEILDYLIESDLLKLTFHNPISGLMYANEKEQLLKYRKLITGDYAYVKYEKIKNMGNFGRVNPNKALGLFSIRREIRQTLAKDYYIDIDIENCHPAILVEICRKNKIKCKNLTAYVTNREEYLNEVIDTYNVTREDAKKLFIRILYFGSFDNWAKDHKIEKKATSKIIKLKEELNEIGNVIYEKNPIIVKLVEKSKEEKNQKEYNKIGSVVSWFLQEYEYEILEAIYYYCKDKNIIENNNAVLCADGIMIDKNKYSPRLLEEFKELVKKDFDLDLNFTVKEMTQDYLEIVRKGIEKKKKDAHNDNMKKLEENMKKLEEIKTEYERIKQEVEKEYFYLTELGRFGKFNEEESKLSIISESTIKLNLAPHQVDKDFFYNMWIKDKARKQYENIIFDPHYNGNKYFNLFTGFELEKIKEYTKKSTANIHKLLDHVLQDCKKYVMEWFAYIIKNKKKTNVAIVLYSDEHGVGKDSIIELFKRILGKKYVSKIENIDDLAKQFNGHIEGKFFIYGDEILAQSKNLYTTLKNTITRTETNINRKGVEEYICDDLANYFFTTNDPLPFKIENNDRRITMIQCNELKLTDEDYKIFYNDLQDKEVLKTFFDELMSIEIPNKIMVHETDLKKEIQDVFLPSPIKYLFKYHKILEGQKYSVQKLFEEIKDFEKSQGYTETKTTKYMTLNLNKVADFTYRTATQRGFKFDNLAEHLKKYNLSKFEEY